MDLVDASPRKPTCWPRPARAGDLPDLVDLLSDAVPGCLPETVWQLPWTWASYSLVHDAAGELVAAGSLQVVDEARVEIRGLTVREDHRGLGLASRVVRELLDRAALDGRSVVCVTKKPEFFARFGFRACPATWVDAGRNLAPRGSSVPRVGMVVEPTRLRGAA